MPILEYSEDRDGARIAAVAQGFLTSVVLQRLGPDQTLPPHIDFAASGREMLEKNGGLWLYFRDKLLALILFHGRMGQADVAVPELFFQAPGGRNIRESIDGAFTRYLLKLLKDMRFEMMQVGFEGGDPADLIASINRVAPQLLLRDGEGRIAPAFFSWHGPDGADNTVVRGAQLRMPDNYIPQEPQFNQEHTLIVKRTGILTGPDPNAGQVTMRPVDIFEIHPPETDVHSQNPQQN